MGFTMSPMSTAAMNAVDRTKAGVASRHAVDDADGRRDVRGRRARRAGGRGRPSRLAQSLPNVPDDVRERLVDALGSGAAVAGAQGNVRAASEAAFVDALGTG